MVAARRGCGRGGTHVVVGPAVRLAQALELAARHGDGRERLAVHGELELEVVADVSAQRVLEPLG